MVLTKINIDPAVAEYVRGRYFDAGIGAVHFPPGSDIYILLYDLVQRRPADHFVDAGNLEFCLPDRRAGKSPETYNYFSARSAKIIGDKLRTAMWADLHDYMDEQKHRYGLQLKDSAYAFLVRYGITSITEDALLKHYQRWRDKMRRRAKRKYSKKNR